jgi:hypothetical protein
MLGEGIGPGKPAGVGVMRGNFHRLRSEQRLRRGDREHRRHPVGDGASRKIRHR